MLCKLSRNNSSSYNTCYANKYIIAITKTSDAVSYLKVLNDLCLCTKRLYSFSHLYNNATLYYSINHVLVVMSAISINHLLGMLLVT